MSSKVSCGQMLHRRRRPHLIIKPRQILPHHTSREAVETVRRLSGCAVTHSEPYKSDLAVTLTDLITALNAEIARLQASIQRHSLALNELQAASAREGLASFVPSDFDGYKVQTNGWNAEYLSLKDALNVLTKQVSEVKAILEEVLANVKQVSIVNLFVCCFDPPLIRPGLHCHHSCLNSTLATKNSSADGRANSLSTSLPRRPGSKRPRPAFGRNDNT